MPNNDPIVVFGDQRPDSLFIDQIYDPDIHGSNPANSGKVIPHEGSLAIERISGNLYYVVSVDPVTYKSTLKPCKFITTDDSGEDTTITTIDYGNERFMLYWDDRVNPTKLEIDSKLVVFGNPNLEYRLVRYDVDGKQEIISLYLDSDDKFSGNRIPLSRIDGNLGAKHCTNCHTLYPMKDGDIVYLEIFNVVGMLVAEFTLFTKRAVIQNDLSSEARPIMKFDATCLQMRGDEWFIYEKQDPIHLGIAPFIELSDGTKIDLVVDNNMCIIYGLEDFIPSYPGYKQRLLLKYYLSANEQSPYSLVGGKYRYLTCDKWLTVVENDSNYSVKISVVPQWDAGTFQYKLKFFAYTNKRDRVFDVTNMVHIETPFNGQLYYKQQMVTFRLNLADLFGATTTITHRQNVWIMLSPYTEFQRYTIKDSADADKVYGIESGTQRRPVIAYNDVVTTDLFKGYFIPTSVFRNKEAFLEAFYYMACPPYNTKSETLPVEPTHFTIRAIDSGGVLIMTPIPVDQYWQLWAITRAGSASQLVGGQVIVEFLQDVGNDQYAILWGSIVDVHQGTSYNYDPNNLFIP